MRPLNEELYRIREMMEIDDFNFDEEDIDDSWGDWDTEWDDVLDDEEVDGEIDEQDDGESTSTSSPMNKWETGLTRGPANQLGVTKWSDSYQPSRGKGNPLW